MCLHGLGRSPADWSRVGPALERFGDVQAPALSPHPSPALRQVAAAMGPQAIVIGHSMGAVLALRAATQTSVPPRAIVLSGCFFPPARNGRTGAASVRDYLTHRVAYLRSRDRSETARGGRAETGRALASLLGLAARRAAFYRSLARVSAPVLVVHARDDHHVPLDFAAAAVAREPGWELRVLQRGGHHAHLTCPALWVEAVVPWLTRLA